MKLPSADQINPTCDPLDGKQAVLALHGKSLQEVVLLFEDNGLTTSQHFYWIGPVAFLYYFKAALSYLEGDKSRDDPDFLNSMISVLESRLFGEFNDYEELKTGTTDFTNFINYAIRNYDQYDIDPIIYGDLRHELRRIQEQLEG